MEYDQSTNGQYSGKAIFILWIVFAPAVWSLVQRGLKVAEERLFQSA